MNILLPDKPDILEPEEVHRLTGYERSSDQIRWLKENGWKHEKNASGRPIISRLYFQVKMCGIDPVFALMPKKDWELDLSTVS